MRGHQHNTYMRAYTLVALEPGCISSDIYLISPVRQWYVLLH